MNVQTQQLIAVDADALERLHDRLDSLERMLSTSTVSPQPEWLSVTAAANHLECSESTIRRKIALGEFEARGSGKSKRVRIS
ncbi:MAG: helix-turn-helix domain-containing protein [Shimia sp.]|uniref:helix-turn-helix domain-containing protein n=1 Tax=Shimia sp. TaxID=1954381 RepID=UPI003B8E4333